MLEISLPITCEARISKSCSMKLNTARFTFFNLKQDTKQFLFQDRYDVRWKKTVEFRAGYRSQGDLQLIFKGNIISSSQVRDGSDISFTIECQDGQFSVANA